MVCLQAFGQLQAGAVTHVASGVRQQCEITTDQRCFQGQGVKAPRLRSLKRSLRLFNSGSASSSIPGTATPPADLLTAQTLFTMLARVMAASVQPSRPIQASMQVCTVSVKDEPIPAEQQQLPQCDSCGRAHLAKLLNVSECSASWRALNLLF